MDGRGSRRAVALTLAAAGLLVAACSGGSGRARTTASTVRSTTSTSGLESTTTSTTTAAAAAVPATAPASTSSTASTAARLVTTVARAAATTAKTSVSPTTVRPASSGGASIGGCPVFPADNPWNQDVRSLPVDPQSATYIASISAGGSGLLHPDFGSDPTYGIPYVITSTAPAVPVTYDEYGDESDPGPFPVPLDAPVEAGSDAHVLSVDTRTCKLVELYHARRSGSRWLAGSGAAFDLRSNRLRPDGWTSADAAGLAILPGLVRYDEVAAGRIEHALRFTVRRSQNGYIHPATHQAGRADATLPPMGLRLRLQAGFDLNRFHGQARVVLTALQRYGMLVADNGTSWYISGATDSRWDDDDLNQLKTVPGTAFEVVQTGPIQR